jgi:AraC-like DNA-binding protein
LASCPSASPSLATVARAVNSSPFHLSRVFRHEVGMSIHKYLVRLRLALALEWLADDTTGLSAVALGLGFASHSHFTTVFRRTFDLSPSAFRRTASGNRLRKLRKDLQV